MMIRSSANGSILRSYITTKSRKIRMTLAADGLKQKSHNGPCNYSKSGS